MPNSSRSVLDPPQKVFVPVPAKQSKLKNFFFYFFVIEHLVIIMLIVALSFFYVRTYAFSEFSVLDEKARSYQPKPINDTIQEIYTPFLAQLATGPQNVKVMNVTMEITEEQLSSTFSSVKLPHVSKIYTMILPNNELYIWIMPEEVPQPLMIRMSYIVTPEGKFDFTTHNSQFGPVPFPAGWFSIPENVSEDVLNEQIQKYLKEYDTKITGFSSEQGKVKVNLEVSNLGKSIQKYREPVE